MNKAAGVLSGLMILTSAGCATHGTLYDWGSYEENLFTYYHTPAAKEAVVADHLTFLAKLDVRGERPAPGLLAEAGTLLLLQGDTQEAIKYYQREHDTWPESRPMMTALIQNLRKD